LDARRLLRDVLSTAQRLADLDSEWRAHYWLGRAAQALRDGTEADRRFRAALSVDRRLRERVPEAQRATFAADPLRRALERALGLPAVVALPVVSRPRPRLVEGSADKVGVDDDERHHTPLVGRMVGRHPRMQAVSGLIQRVAPSDSIVLIRGESGTGKELVAEALHEGSARRGRPFIKVNCGAIVESLLLSELFGHERGAFTGALQRKKGRFEVADGGTLFLDEIGDVSPRTQVALLRVLQERQFERVGGTSPVRVDVRIVCATHRNLEEMVARGEFREDLYYRLRGIQIELPALRERASDVPLIATAILAGLATQRGQAPLSLSDEANLLLARHAWPGNVRELENVLRSASLFADGSQISARDLGELVASGPRASVELADAGTVGAAPLGGGVVGLAPAAPAAEPASIWQRLADEGLSLKELKTRVEVECIERALAASGGNITRAAEKLGMKRPRLSQLIKEHGLRAEENK
jgi:DNA-binding NtrC family response regulator